MNLDLTDTQHASRFMRDLWRDQLPFATSKEINRTALDFQGTQRHRMVSIFNVRRPTFVLRAVKIKPFSTKRLLRARVLIDPPGGRKRADILTKFESDTQKTPFSGSRIAIPTDNVPRTPAGVIRKRWRPKALNLRGHGSGSRALPGKGHMVLVGDRKTVAFLKPGGRGGIFERDGPDLVPLYWFAPRVRIRPNLRFVHTARRTIRQRWERNFTRAFNESVRTARVRGPSFAGIGRLRWCGGEGGVMARRRVLFAPELLVQICQGTYRVKEGTGVPWSSAIVEAGVESVIDRGGHLQVFVVVEHEDLEESDEPLVPIIEALEVMTLRTPGQVRTPEGGPHEA